MDLRKARVLMSTIALLFFCTVFAQSDRESDFVAKLDAEEAKEYQALLNHIMTMSNEEYATFLNKRIEKSFEGKSSGLRTFVVVEVTDEMNQPEPGFFQKFLSPVPDPEDFGLSKIDSILFPPVNKKGASIGLVFKDHYRSQNRLRHFHRLEGVLDENSAKALVGQKDIIDVYVADQRTPGSEFIATHTPTGRILPKRSQKIYSDEALADGFFQELMSKFEEQERLTVEVSFKKPVGYEYTKAWHDQMELVTDQFLESWPEYEFETVFKKYSHVVLITTRDHARAIKEDERVKLIKYKDSRVQLLKKGI